MSNKRTKPEHDNSLSEEEVFKKSRATVRSPTRENKSEIEGQEMEEIRKLLAELKKDIKTEIQDLKIEIREENKEIKNDIREIKEEIKQNGEEMADIKHEMQQMKERWAKEKLEMQKENEMIKMENKKIIEEMKELRRTSDVLEKEKKKNNLIISGIIMDTEDPIKLQEGMVNIIRKHLGINADIRRAQRIGIKTCLIELKGEEEKLAILKNKNKLKNVRSDNVIWISEDLTQGEKEKVKVLREKAKHLREEGRTVKIGYNKITVGDKEWRWNYKERRVVESEVSKN